MGAAISYKYTNNYSTLHGYKVMTVRIDETKSNPDTCCTYQDDAVGMSSGANADEWTKFFGYRPCLLRNSLNGLEVKYLNPDDYTKFIDGSTADISSGYAGNVMIEFPRRGIKLNRSGNYLYVSMTDDPDADGYNYYAHTRGTTIYDNVYISAYPTRSDTSSIPVLTSLADDKTIETMDDITDYREYANNMGSNFGVMTFYQWTYLQVMMVLQFCTLNSRKAIGIGETGGSYSPKDRGWAKYEGLFAQVPYVADGTIYGYFKAFGIEDFYGREGVILEGIVAKYNRNTSSYTFYTSLNEDEFRNDSTLPASYTEVGTCSIPPYGTDPDDMYGWIQKTSQNSNSGFLPSLTRTDTASEVDASKYYCATITAPDMDRSNYNYELVSAGSNKYYDEDTRSIFSITIGGSPRYGTYDRISIRTQAKFVCYK